MQVIALNMGDAEVEQGGQKVLATNDSFQMTSGLIRNPDGFVVAFLDRTEGLWVDNDNLKWTDIVFAED